MPSFTIYHNPRCSKSRATLALLREKGIEPEIVEYLNDPPDVATLKELAGKLGLRPGAFVRKKEAAFKDLNLDPDDDESLLRAISSQPKLLERPIVVSGQRAVLGRPPENVLDLI